MRQCPHRKVTYQDGAYTYEYFAECDKKQCQFFREGVGEDYCDNPTNFTQARIEKEK